MNRKLIAPSATFLLGLLFGFLLRNLVNGPSPQHPETATQLPVRASDQARSKFAQLSEADLKDYYALKTQRERFEKADEILGKIVGIFIADLGLKVERVPLAGQVMVSPSPSISPVALPTPSTPELSLSVKEAVRLAEKDLDTIANDKDVDQLVHDSQFANLADAFKSFTPITRVEGWIAEFLGSFRGETRLDVEDHRSLPTEIAFARDGEKIHFDIHIQDHTMFATQFAGSAKPEALFSTISGGRAVYLSIDYEESKYLQLYFAPATHQLVGTYYKKWSKPGEFKAIGTIKLR